MACALTIVLPDLWQIDSAEIQQSYLMRLKNLSQLLARARVETLESRRVTLVEHWFGYTENLPAAPLLGLGQGLSTREGYWVRVDPICARVDKSGIYLQALDEISLDLSETQELLLTLNGHLSKDNLKLVATTAQAWYMRLPEAMEFCTSAPWECYGQDLSTKYPQGPHSRFFKRLHTELQMLLHQHPVNQRRRQEGKYPVNDLWLWGTGELPRRNVTHFTGVLSDDPSVVGLAKLHSLDIFDDIKPSLEQTEHLLWYFSQPRIAKLAGDFERWRAQLLRLDSYYFSAVLQGLLERKITQVDFYFNEQMFYQITLKQLKKWWYCRRPLKEVWNEHHH